MYHSLNNSIKNTCIGGLVVKLAVAIHNWTVSASPGFDSRPMHFASIVDCGRWC